MKKSILKIGAITMVSFFASISMVNATSYKNYNGIEMTSEELNNLKNLGFTENQIYNMDIDEFESNKDLKGEIVSIDKKYLETIYTYTPTSKINIMGYAKEDLNNELDDESKWKVKSVETKEISEEEFNRKVSNKDNILVVNDVNPDVKPGYYRTLTTTIIKTTSGYRVRNDLSWYTFPKTRSIDIYGISVNPSIVEAISRSQYAKQSYTRKDTCTEAVTSGSETFNANHSSWRPSNGNYGIAFQIPKDLSVTHSWDYGSSYPCTTGNKPGVTGTVQAYQKVNKLEAYMYYDLVKHQNSTISAYGSYQHATKSLSLSAALTFSMSYGGSFGGVFNLTATNVEKYDNAPGTHAQVFNPSW